jgi:hypothetical protein
MRERRRRSASDESEMGNAISGLGRGGRTVEGRPVSETPGLRSRANQRCPETPCGRPRTRRGHGLICSRGLLEAQQGKIWPMGLLLSIFLLKREIRRFD